MRSARGLGGDWWRIGDLKRLPMAAFDAFAAIIDLLLKARAYPPHLAIVLISLFKKTKGGDRPIGALPALYAWVVKIWAQLGQSGQR